MDETKSEGQKSLTEFEQPKARPLGLADAMIFIIAVGLGLALARPAIVLTADAFRSDPRWPFQTLAGAVSLGRVLNILLLNFLFFVVPAFLIVRLRRPRPSLRSLIFQPGFVACAAPVLIIVAMIPFLLLPLSGLAEQVVEIGGQVLLVVAAPLAWICLIASRRWNPEPGWIDRLGRFVGVLGMVCTPAHLLLIRLPY
jgi:hypothetical protein